MSNPLVVRDSADVLERFGYINTASSAGKGSRVLIVRNDVHAIRSWINANGNPSYTFLMNDGAVLYLVDDYGALNGLAGVAVRPVARRRDLFAGWLAS